MGFMENLRRNVFGVFGTIILFIILILFLWGDASQGGSNTFQGGGAGTAGVVNDEEISNQEFELRVSEAIDNAQTPNPNRDSVRAIVWDQLVQEKLLYQSAAKYGLTVSDEELAAIMFNNPPQSLASMFTDSSGAFMREMYVQMMQDMDGFFLSNEVNENTAQLIRNAVLSSQRQIRLNTTVARMFDLVGSLYPHSPVLLRASFDASNASASGEFVLLSANSIADDQVSVSEEEITTYYNEHIESYRQKPAKIAQYAMLRLGPSGKDSQKVGSKFARYAEALQGATTREDSSAAFGRVASDIGTRLMSGTSFKALHDYPAEARAIISGMEKNEIVGPVRIEGRNYFVNLVDVRDSGARQVRASHVLLQSPEENDSALSMATRITSEASGGADFAGLVAQYSQDPASAQKEGDVEWVSEKTNFVPEFKAAVLSAESVGQVIGPVRTDYGYHIIKITGISERSYKVRALNFDVEISQTTRQQLRRKASGLKERLEEGEEFETVAEELGLQVLETAPISNGNVQIAGTSRVASFVNNADMSDVSDVISLPDESLIVAQVSQVKRGGPTPVEEVRPQIEAIVKTKKKVEMLKGKADQVHSSVSGSGDLNAALSVDSSVAIRPFTNVNESGSFPDVGNDPALAAAVFSLSPGQVSGPIKGASGYYVVRLDSLSRKGDAEWESSKGEYIKTQLQQRRQALFTAWFDNILQTANVRQDWE